jgi:hypothetical protein
MNPRSAGTKRSNPSSASSAGSKVFAPRAPCRTIEKRKIHWTVNPRTGPTMAKYEQRATTEPAARTPTSGPGRRG